MDDDIVVVNKPASIPVSGLNDRHWFNVLFLSSIFFFFMLSSSLFSHLSSHLFLFSINIFFFVFFHLFISFFFVFISFYQSISFHRIFPYHWFFIYLFFSVSTFYLVLFYAISQRNCIPHTPTRFINLPLYLRANFNNVFLEI